MLVKLCKEKINTLIGMITKERSRNVKVKFTSVYKLFLSGILLPVKACSSIYEQMVIVSLTSKKSVLKIYIFIYMYVKIAFTPQFIVLLMMFVNIPRCAFSLLFQNKAQVIQSHLSKEREIRIQQIVIYANKQIPIWFVNILK